jgi:hypothetical protein
MKKIHCEENHNTTNATTRESHHMLKTTTIPMKLIITPLSNLSTLIKFSRSFCSNKSLTPKIPIVKEFLDI